MGRFEQFADVPVRESFLNQLVVLKYIREGRYYKLRLIQKKT